LHKEKRMPLLSTRGAVSAKGFGLTAGAKPPVTFRTYIKLAPCWHSNT